jgi:hypothetical protein
MKKRNNPETSTEAFKSLRPEELAEVYCKIILALSKIGEGTFEQISAVAKLEPQRVWRRLSEMLKMGLVYRPGKKIPLKSNRLGYTWMLTKDGLPKTDKSEKALSGKSVSDYSRSLIPQPTLF